MKLMSPPVVSRFLVVLVGGLLLTHSHAGWAQTENTAPQQPTASPISQSGEVWDLLPNVPRPHPAVYSLLEEAYWIYKTQGFVPAQTLVAEALKRSRAEHDRLGEAVTMLALAESARVKLGDEASAPFIKQAQTALDAVEGPEARALVLASIATIAHIGGYSDTSKAYMKLTRTQLDALNSQMRGRTLVTISLIGDVEEERRALLQEALRLGQEAHDVRLQAHALMREAVLDRGLLNYKDAETKFERALALARQNHDLHTEAEVASYQALAWDREEYNRHLGLTVTALKLATDSGDVLLQTRLLKRLSSAQTSLGRLAEATTSIERALSLYQGILNPVELQQKWEACCIGAELYNLFPGDAAKRARALELAQEGALLGHEYGSAAQEMRALADLNVALHNNGQHVEARQTAETALQIARERTDPRTISQALVPVATDQLMMGELQKALDLAEEAVAKSNDNPQANHIAWLCAAALGRKELAFGYCEHALKLLDVQRAGLSGWTQGQLDFATTNQGWYQEAIRLHLQSGDDSGAFAVAEKMRARTLLETQTGQTIVGRDLSEEEKLGELKLRQQADRLNEALIALASSQITSIQSQRLRSQLQQAESELTAYTDALYARHTGLAEQRATQTVQANDLASTLEANHALVVFSLLDDGKGKEGLDTLEAFVLRKQGQTVQLTRHEWNIKADELTSQINVMHSACAKAGGTATDRGIRLETKGKAPAALQKSSRQLGSLLLEPLLGDLKGCDKLTLCPDGPLWNLPWAALLVKEASTNGAEQYALQKWQLSLAQSATLWQARQLTQSHDGMQTRPQSILAVAAPDFGGPERFTQSRPISLTSSPGSSLPPTPSLAAAIPPEGSENTQTMWTRGGGLQPLPGTVREAIAIKQSFPQAQILTGSGAQEGPIKSAMPNYRMLHFATHGLLNDVSPMLSSIVLANPADDKQPQDQGEDGLLTAREILDLHLNADLVVLSACDTGRGTRRGGEGVIGLTWALSAAGARAQIVSQWSVNDQTTATLMTNFYAQLKNKPPTAALREAALQLLGNKNTSHPYYWAPFVLLGE